MISNAKPCQLEEALKSIDLKNKPFFCKHNSIKNTNAVWGIGVFVLLSNFVLSLCPCHHFNCKCTYTRPKLNVWCVSALNFYLLPSLKLDINLRFVIQKLNIINITYRPFLYQRFLLLVWFASSLFISFGRKSSTQTL